jgi:subtilisin-like proprotein convertase family protein
MRIDHTPSRNGILHTSARTATARLGKALLATLLFLLALPSSPHAQTTLFSENFEAAGNLTTGAWTGLIFGTPTPNPRNRFLVFNGCGSEITSKSMEVFAFNATNNTVACGYVNTPITSTYFTGIRSPLINATGQSNLKLSYQWRGVGELPSFDFGQFMYSTNGTTWTFFGPILNGATAVQTVSNLALPAALNNTNFFIGWRFVSDFTVVGPTGLIVDNISVVACPTTPPAPPVVSGGTPSICGLGRTTATLTPGAGGSTINWYTAASGGAPVLVNAASVQVDFFTYGTVTYYASTVTSCGTESATRTAVTFTSNPGVSVAPSAAPGCVCPGGTVNLAANGLRETLFTNNTVLPIPDATPGGVNSPITVAGFNPAALAANSVLSVRLNIAHTFDSDLEIRLIAPNGSSIILVDNRGGAGDNFVNTILNPTPVAATATPIAAGVAPFTGYFIPDNAYSGLTGPLNGTWNLQIEDQALLDAGTLQGWELILRTDANVNYSWTSSPAGFTSSAANPTANPTATTTYTVTATDATGTGCSATGSVTVTVNPSPTVTITPGGPTTVCSPDCVTLTANSSTGNGPFTYLWSNGATTQSISACASGTYSVTVTTVDGCTGTASQSVTVNTFSAGNLVFTETMGNVSGTTLIAVHEANNGFDNDPYTMTGTADVRNTTPSTGYTGASGGANIFLTNSPPGRIFEISGINTVGFSTMGIAYGIHKSTTASNGTDLIVQVSSNGVTYTTLGSLPFLPTGTGTAIWHTRNSFGAIPSVPNLRIRFVNLGTSATQYRIDDVVLAGFSNQAVAQATGPTSFCDGGSVVIGASLATSYLWNTGATTQTITATTSGSYQATLTDANGCTKVTNAVTVTVFPQPSVTATSTNVTCNGFADGTATANPSGGTAPYSYLWSPGGQTTQTATGLAPGTYTVNITDANGCGGSTTSIWSENMGNVTSNTTINAHEANNGFQNVAFTMSGDGEVRNTQTSAGSYPTASGGANVFLTSIGGPEHFEIAGINSTGYGAFSISFGIFKSTVASDGSDFTVSWSTDGVTYTNLNWGTLPTGTGTAVWHYRTATGYIPASTNLRIRFMHTNALTTQYRVDDVLFQGIGGQATVLITEPPVLVNTLIPQVYNGGWNVSCNGASDGMIFANTSGGTAPYSYAWSNGATTQMVSGLSAGTYSVTVTDANGCTDVQSITLTEPPLMTDSYTASTYNCGYNVSCNGATDGSIDYSVSGGTPPYAYNWSNGANTEDISGLGAGTYSVTASDRNGCTTTETITLTEPPVLTTSLTTSMFACGFGVSCSGASDGSVSSTTTGGCAPYSYQWSNGGMGGFINGVTAGSYSVTVTDANGCQAFATAEITEPAPVTVTCSPNTTVFQGWPGSDCATITASGIGGGCAPYTIAWSNGATTASQTVCPTVSTDYTVTVTDANGCTATCVTRVCVIDVRCGNNLQKIEICHNPPGNAQTICVSPNAVANHLSHGDHLGACGTNQPCGAPLKTAPVDGGTPAQGHDVVELIAFPNPFAVSTTLEFLVPTDMSMRLTVFNMNGQQMAVLFDANAEAGRHYTVDWKADGITSGIYFAQLITSTGEVKTLKLVVER